MYVKYMQKLQPNRKDSIWYDGDVVYFRHNNRECMICAVGEIKICSQEGLVFDGEERNGGFDFKFETDDDIKNIGYSYDDKYYWENNNWFEILYKNSNEIEWEDIGGSITNDYVSAIKYAIETLENKDYWE